MNSTPFCCLCNKAADVTGRKTAVPRQPEQKDASIQLAVYQCDSQDYSVVLCSSAAATNSELVPSRCLKKKSHSEISPAWRPWPAPGCRPTNPTCLRTQGKTFRSRTSRSTSCTATGVARESITARVDRSRIQGWKRNKQTNL